MEPSNFNTLIDMLANAFNVASEFVASNLPAFISQYAWYSYFSNLGLNILLGVLVGVLVALICYGFEVMCLDNYPSETPWWRKTLYNLTILISLALPSFIELAKILVSPTFYVITQLTQKAG